MSWLSNLLDRIFGRHNGDILPPKPPDVTPSTEILKELLVLHNSYRVQHQLLPLKLDARLCQSAQQEADACARLGRLDHNAGGNPFRRIATAGYNWKEASENIAEGQRSPREVVADWMSDAGHRSNVLGQFTDVGFGVNGLYWCADYGRE